MRVSECVCCERLCFPGFDSLRRIDKENSILIRRKRERELEKSDMVLSVANKLAWLTHEKLFKVIAPRSAPLKSFWEVL